MILDRVMETSTSTGTGTFTLSGAVAGYTTFPDGTFKYAIEAVDSNGNPSGEYEVGEGTVASSVLTRTSVEASSNSGSAVNFSAGSKRVFITATADYLPPHVVLADQATYDALTPDASTFYYIPEA